MNFTEKTITQNYFFDGKVFRAHVDEIELPDGNKAAREVIDHSGGVCVAAIDRDDNIYLVRQFRYPYKEVLLEVPAGKLEKNEDPLEAGKRELMEETGCVGTGYYSLGELYPSPGYCNEILYMYGCRVESEGEACPDKDEFVEAVKIPLKEAVRMVLENEIRDAKTQTAVLKASLTMNIV